MADTYRKALHDAREELIKLLAQKEAIDKRVTQLQQTVSSLAALCGEKVESDEPNYIQNEILRVYGDILETLTGKPGLTDAVRAALKAFDRPMLPVEVRDALISLGYDLSIYSNVMASIHTILKRLVESKEIEEVDKDGRKAYQTKKSSNKYNIRTVKTSTKPQTASSIIEQITKLDTPIDEEMKKK
ncbi:MAG TPA: hypothetical protein VF779_09305 [Pyrinomonadaceae bacterium]